MHIDSYQEMGRLVRTYLNPQQRLHILDLGSFDVNGAYRPLFDRANWRYEGADIAPGPNVDIVLHDPYRWQIAADSYDVVISGQAFEHIEFFWLTWMEMIRVLKAGGIILLIAPGAGPEHRYPVDCWRFYRDGMRALAGYAGVQVLEAETRWQNQWADTIGVFRKPAPWAPPLYLPVLKRGLRQRARSLMRRIRTSMRQRRLKTPPHYQHPAATWFLHHQAMLFAPGAPVRWMGVPILKNALDAWIYQEILFEVKPQAIVELGSYAGGSTLFFCHMLDLIGGDAIVVSVDKDRSLFAIEHPRLVVVNGDCADSEVHAQVVAACCDRRTLVVHDADHSEAAVLRDLRRYSHLVSEGSYFIVEDGIVDQVDFPDTTREPGPLPAIRAFLAARDDFIADPTRERYHLTYNPTGFLKRVRPEQGGAAP